MIHSYLTSPIPCSLQVSFADGATNDLQALQDEVQSRYLDLLRQVESGGLHGNTSSSASSSQEELTTGDEETMTAEALAALLLSAREELIDLRTVLAQEDQFWAVVDGDDLSVFIPLEDRTEAEREALLGPMPLPLDPSLVRNDNEDGETTGMATTTNASTANAPMSMKMLKSKVDTALLDLSMRRRGEVLLWEANDALRLTAKSTRKVTQPLIHSNTHVKHTPWQVSST